MECVSYRPIFTPLPRLKNICLAACLCCVLQDISVEVDIIESANDRFALELESEIIGRHKQYISSLFLSENTIVSVLEYLASGYKHSSNIGKLDETMGIVSVAKFLEQGYGDCTEFSFAAYMLLKEVNIQAVVVYLSYLPEIDGNIPSGGHSLIGIPIEEYPYSLESGYHSIHVGGATYVIHDPQYCIDINNDNNKYFFPKNFDTSNVDVIRGSRYFKNERIVYNQ